MDDDDEDDDGDTFLVTSKSASVDSQVAILDDRPLRSAVIHRPLLMLLLLLRN